MNVNDPVSSDRRALKCSRLHNPETEMETCKEIEVTPAMIEAGLAEMFEHRYGDDPRRMLEHVYRAMFYASEAASSTNVSR